MSTRRPIITIKKRPGARLRAELELAPEPTAPVPAPPPPAPGPAQTPPVVREPLVIEHGDRRVIVKAVRRKNRFICVAMGRERPGPTKAYNGIKRAREEAGRLVAEGIADHVFVVRIVESAKLEGAR